MIYGLGMLESGITFDYGQLVLDCEFARMIKHTVEGFAVNDFTLAKDVIREIGPFGNFLTHKHTLAGMRSQSRAELIDRTMREEWLAKGAVSIQEKAMQKVRHILETHKPEPLPDDVRALMRAIVTEAEAENRRQ
jgi:trimethylamine--corrinoid protein Co-methyltransferase